MYSLRVASLFYIAIPLLLVIMTQVVSAAPADRNLADVVAENHKLACYGRSCYIKNESVTTDAVATPLASSSIPLATATAVSANGALTFRQPAIVLPAMIAGTSLLMLL